MKIVVLDGHCLNPGDLSWDSLNPFGEVTVYPRTRRSEQTIERIGDAEIVLLNKTPINRVVLDACPNIRMIGVLATGYNVVDCAAARSRGIVVCNVPGYATNSVAQFTMALLLELCHRIGRHDEAVHHGRWERCPDFCFWDTPQIELAGKTMGIIGYGNIGRSVGRMARAFGMHVLYYTRTKHDKANIVSLDTLLTQSDIVSLHCPLFPETKGLIGKEALAKMKDGAILLNTARGQLVDEKALVDALNSGKLRGAAIDTVAHEPLASDHPLMSAPNCIITPHMAWTPVECRQRIIDTTVENIRSFLAGDPIHVVN